LTLLDAYPIVAYLVGEPAADEVQALLAAGDASAISFNVAEAVDVASRVHGAAEPDVRDAIELLVATGLLTVTAPGAPTAFRAAAIRIAYYHRRDRPVSLADCFLLAAASGGNRVATADPDVVHVARAEAISVLPLPDSSGRRP
jgi:predicted nucleic acid-binding protein